ncbi:MAG TPA: serine/threonine-protein kinase [Kofleriaceae bacterium]|nr:serine/threonine-protein kinase [Kofleriaceae bacterium]
MTSATDDTVAEPAADQAERARQSLPGYQVGEVIGRGGMGEVVAARDEQIERDVAVKRLRGDEPSADAVARFLREARIQARLDHPAIVPVHELGTDAHGLPYFTMKRLAGETMRERLGAGGPIQPMLRALVDVCFAIELAHTRRIVHRDLKPANIMLGDYNDVYVLDWGIARDLDEQRASTPAIPGDSKPGHTEAGALLGTPGYMAPEQMRGEPVGPPADVYALGAVLFEILAGESLHPLGQAAFASTLGTPTASPSQRRPDRAVPPELDALCVEALAEQPSARPTARALGERIQRYLDGDRDLEHRRAVAAEELALARAGVASGDPARRRAATQAAGRALALDPASREAAQLVTQLIVEPPRELPPELVESLDRNERDLDRARSRRAAIAFASIFAAAPAMPFIHVTSWPRVATIVGACVMMAGLGWVNWRVVRLPLWSLFVSNLVFAVVFAQLASPFVLMPMVVCGQILALSTVRWTSDHGVWFRVWVAVTMLAPFALEGLAIMPSTWRIAHEGLFTYSALTDSRNDAAVVALVVGQVGIALVVAGYGLTIARARREAARRAHIQAWHLQHMILPTTNQLG